MEQSKSSVILTRVLRTLAYAIISLLITGVGAVVVFLIKQDVSTIDAIRHLWPQMIDVFQIAVIPVALTGIVAGLDKLRRWINPDQPEPLANEPTGQN